MRVARRVAAESLQHEELLRGVGEVVVAPDHVGDPHVGVVDRHRQVVERRPVAASDDEVVLSAILEVDGPRITSSTTVSPSSGTRRRIAAPSTSCGSPR